MQSTRRTCKVTAPHLIARGSGSVILVSSIAGLRGLLGVAHYTAAKHGVVGLMRSLANELAPHGIRVNSVHPTNVDTPLIQNAAVASAFRPDLDREPTQEEFAEAARSMNMLAIPWVEPVDVANACLFLRLRGGALHHRGHAARGCGQHAAIDVAGSGRWPVQKPEHGALECILGLDHRPMAAVREHVGSALGMCASGSAPCPEGLRGRRGPR